MRFSLSVFVRVGMAPGPNCTGLEAVAGMAAEAIDFPLYALVTARLLKN